MDLLQPPDVLDIFEAAPEGGGCTNHREKLKVLYERIHAVGKTTTQYVRRIVAEDAEIRAARARGDRNMPAVFMASAYEQQTVRALYQRWEEHYVSDAENMREIRIDSTEGGKKTVKYTIGMHVFFELTRLNALLRRPDLATERDNLARYSRDTLSCDSYATLFTLSDRTRSPMWIAIVNSFEPDVVTDRDPKKGADNDETALAMRAKLRGMWSKPIMSYTQSEVRALIFFLTQQLDEVPTRDAAVVNEYRTVFQLVWLRVAELTQELHSEHVLDEEDMRCVYPGASRYCFNRMFAAFCSIYLGEILQRFFYYDLLRPNATIDVPRSDLIAASGHAWVTKVVMELAEEAFDDLYTRTAAEEGYTFVGDDVWFKFMYPNTQPGRGACIATFRPHLYKRFHSESHVSKTAALVSSCLTARMFMLSAVDEYIKMNAAHIQWKSAVVMANTDVPKQTDLLVLGLCPYLVQVFSTYWVYDNGRVHICDSIFEAIGVWFWLLHTRYDDMLHGNDMKSFVRDVLPSSVRAEMAAARFEL